MVAPVGASVTRQEDYSGTYLFQVLMSTWNY